MFTSNFLVYKYYSAIVLIEIYRYPSEMETIHFISKKKKKIIILAITTLHVHDN